MPIYDYRCTACGRQVEVIHAIDASGPTTCEVCGGIMRKALSPPAIHFRGGGWAKKDARAASTKASAAGAAASATDTAARDDSTSGGKPATDASKGSAGTPDTKPGASSTTAAASPSD